MYFILKGAKGLRKEGGIQYTLEIFFLNYKKNMVQI